MSFGHTACRVPQQAYFMLSYYKATCDVGTQNDGNTITTRAKLKHILEKRRWREKGSVGGRDKTASRRRCLDSNLWLLKSQNVKFIVEVLWKTAGWGVDRAGVGRRRLLVVVRGRRTAWKLHEIMINCCACTGAAAVGVARVTKRSGQRHEQMQQGER